MEKKKACGLCGKTAKLTKTKCCNSWICDDEDQYVLCSYAKNSCYRNHQRCTLCSLHAADSHSGKWQDCKKCKKNHDPIDYVYYTTNKYNFEKLNIPKIPINCSNCDFVSLELEDFAYTILQPFSENACRTWYCYEKECLKAQQSRKN